jgi:hypothetical protein
MRCCATTTTCPERVLVIFFFVMRGKDVVDSALFPSHERIALLVPASFISTFAVPLIDASSVASTKIVLEF